MRDLVQALRLEPNLEGGFYRQTWESDQLVPGAAGPRPLANTIYYLLNTASPIGHFHRNRSDITHFLHRGGPIHYLLVSPQGELQGLTLGWRPQAGELLQFTCPGGWWKSSHLPAGVEEGLISEITSPAFRYQDHAMATLDQFDRDFPHLLAQCRPFIR